jgi:molybdopterin/thiamine biosynthesis adenylyltransferase
MHSCIQPCMLPSDVGAAAKGKAPMKEKSEKRSTKSKANSAAKRQSALNPTSSTEAYPGESAYS